MPRSVCSICLPTGPTCKTSHRGYEYPQCQPPKSGPLNSKERSKMGTICQSSVFSHLSLKRRSSWLALTGTGGEIPLWYDSVKQLQLCLFYFQKVIKNWFERNDWCIYFSDGCEVPVLITSNLFPWTYSQAVTLRCRFNMENKRENLKIPHLLTELNPKYKLGILWPRVIMQMPFHLVQDKK